MAADKKLSKSLPLANENTTVEHVKNLIEKFDHREHKSTSIKNDSQEQSASDEKQMLPDVVSHEKCNETCKFSPDLHRLLERATERPKVSPPKLKDTKSFDVLNLEVTFHIDVFRNNFFFGEFVSKE